MLTATQHHTQTIHYFNTCTKSQTQRTKSQITRNSSPMTFPFKSDSSYTTWQNCGCSSFYYNFLTKYFIKEIFELAQMDMDSLYFTVCNKSVEDIIKPEMRRSCYKDRHLWLPSEHCSDCAAAYVTAKFTNEHWSIKPCCAK